MILIFDLDDTLYPEITYVKSGFKSVSLFLKNDFGIPEDQSYAYMYNFLKKHGRGKVFNYILDKNGIYNSKNLKKCISVYRNHVPSLRLYKDAERCLNRFCDYDKYLVTDGNIRVQRKKIMSLGLSKHFKKSIPTYQYGISHSKPSIMCFNRIMEYENCSSSKMVYIGDNPYKDFINIKKIGIHTIRILRGSYKNIKLDSDHEADYSFKSLDGLSKKFIRNQYENR
jgi:putative hydrolase of the HAD superfamily